MTAEIVVEALPGTVKTFRARHDQQTDKLGHLHRRQRTSPLASCELLQERPGPLVMRCYRRRILGSILRERRSRGADISALKQAAYLFQHYLRLIGERKTLPQRIRQFQAREEVLRLCRDDLTQQNNRRIQSPRVVVEPLAQEPLGSDQLSAAVSGVARPLPIGKANGALALLGMEGVPKRVGGLTRGRRGRCASGQCRGRNNPTAPAEPSAVNPRVPVSSPRSRFAPIVAQHASRLSRTTHAQAVTIEYYSEVLCSGTRVRRTVAGTCDTYRRNSEG